MIAVVTVLAGTVTAQETGTGGEDGPLPPFVPVIPLVFCAIAVVLISAIVTAYRTTRAQAEHLRANGKPASAIVTAKHLEYRSSGGENSTTTVHHYAELQYDAVMPTGAATGVHSKFAVSASEFTAMTERITRVDVVYDPEDPRHAALRSSVDPSSGGGVGAAAVNCCAICFPGLFFVIGLGASAFMVTLVSPADIGVAIAITVVGAILVVVGCGFIGRTCGRRARFGALGTLIAPGAGALASTSATADPAAKTPPAPMPAAAAPYAPAGAPAPAPWTQPPPAASQAPPPAAAPPAAMAYPGSATAPLAAVGKGNDSFSL